MSYTLPSVRGLVVHMEDRQTSILIPKNRYDQVRRSLTLKLCLSGSCAILPVFSVELSCGKLQTCIQHIWYADIVQAGIWFFCYSLDYRQINYDKPQGAEAL